MPLESMNIVLKRYYHTGKPKTPEAARIQELWRMTSNAYHNTVAKNPRLLEKIRDRFVVAERDYDRAIAEGLYSAQVEDLLYKQSPLLAMVEAFNRIYRRGLE